MQINFFLLYTLLTVISLPVRGEPIRKISDFNVLAKEGEKITFACPTKKRMPDSKPKKPYIRSKEKLYEDCWFKLEKSHINIMDQHFIKKEDVLTYWDRSYVDLDFLGKHFLSYNSGNDQIKRVEIRTKVRGTITDTESAHNKITEAITLWLLK